MDCETALRVINEPKVFPRLLDRDYVHEAGWIRCVRPDFAVHFDQALHHDGLCLARIKRIL